VDNVVRETKIHIEMLSGYGITVEDIENTPETLATRAYGGYLIDAAVQGRVGL
jgi:hydroxymethylpyrimidine/phosphomethylpyrimidine kinase